MSFIAVTGRDVAWAAYQGKHQYLTAEQIAAMIKRKKGLDCTAEQVREIIRGYNEYGVCFDEADLLGQKMYRAVHYIRWYPPRASEVKNKKTNWAWERRRGGRLKCTDHFDRFYFDWLMDGGDFPVLFQACYYYFDKMQDFLRLSTEELTKKLAEWARSTPEKMVEDLDNTVLECWKIRCARERLEQSALCAARFLSPAPPDYMTSRELIDRLTLFISAEIRLEQCYSLIWASPREINHSLSWVKKAIDSRQPS